MYEYLIELNYIINGCFDNVLNCVGCVGRREVEQKSIAETLRERFFGDPLKSGKGQLENRVKMPG